MVGRPPAGVLDQPSVLSRGLSYTCSKPPSDPDIPGALPGEKVDILRDNPSQPSRTAPIAMPHAQCVNAVTTSCLGPASLSGLFSRDKVDSNTANHHLGLSETVIGGSID